MNVLEVSIDLPFFLRLEGSYVVRYDNVCQEAQVKELLNTDVRITISRKPVGAVDKGNWLQERSAVAINVDTPARLSDSSVGVFAIKNCLEILNRVIVSYQATTGEVSNAGFIFPLGTSDMRLFAEIRVNGQDFRDRWPSHSTNTFPLSNSEIGEFNRYLSCKEGLPLSKLFLTNAILSLERGQYSLAVLQASTAVELRMTQVVCVKLRAAGWSDQAVAPFEKMTLGGKLQIRQTDPRSLETYFSGVSGFSGVYAKARDSLTPLRNDVAHRGHLASHDQALQALRIAAEFLKIVS